MRYHFVWGLTLCLTVILCLSADAQRAVQAQSDERCFPETGYCISGRFREFWEQNGGLSVFGLPITPQQAEVIGEQPLQVQWFERTRLELHPENTSPYDVLLGRLGVDRLDQQGRNWFTFPQSVPHPGCRFFSETGHNVCGDILATWRANGLELDGQSGKSDAENLALFGLPLSDAQIETLSDGKQYTVQWFERARVELHPENAPPYHVLLGLLGSEVYAERSAGDGTPDVPSPAPQPSPQPQPVPQPQPIPPPGGNCDPAYPDVCIPSPPPDLDCRDIPYRDFRVLPPDPHRFDGDKDGIGCES